MKNVSIGVRVTGFIAAALMASTAYAGTLRTYHFGCSTTDQFITRGQMAGVAAAFGHTYEIRSFTVPGCGMHCLWVNGGSGMTGELTASSWDGVICAAFPNGWELGVENDAKYMGYFYEPARSRNPQCILYVWSVYPNNDPGNPGWDAQWNATGPMDYASRQYQENLYWALRNRYDAAHVKLLPIVHAMNKLHTLITSGQTRRFRSIFELYGDGIHLNQYGGYLGVMVHYAVLSKANPAGAPLAGRWGYWGEPVTLDLEFAELAWRVAWETVTELSEYTGVSASPVSVDYEQAMRISPARSMFQRGSIDFLAPVLLLNGRVSIPHAGGGTRIIPSSNNQRDVIPLLLR